MNPRLSLASSLFAVSATLLWTPAPASAQVGGRHEVLHTIEGGTDSNRFGKDVSGAGDVNNDGFDDYIIGDPDASPGGRIDLGSAFVYSGADQTVLYHFDGPTLFQKLGTAVSGAGDINLDGYDDFLIGSPYKKWAELPEAGIAQIYSGIDGSLLYEFHGTASEQNFGWDVSHAGDVDADGVPDVIIGSRSQKAFVYSGATGTIIYTFSMIDAWLGIRVAGGGDVNGDGFDDLAISNPYSASGGGSGSPDGIALVYSGADGSLIYELEGYGSDISFGGAISFAGDVDADGYSDLIIGALGDLDEYHRGTAYVFSGKEGNEIYRFTGQSSKQYFGYSVSGAGDWNRDGYDDVMVGAPSPQEQTGGFVKVFSGFDGSKILRFKASDNINFGHSVAYVGDANGDGFPNCIAGAPTHPTYSPYGGAAAIIGLNPHLTVNTTFVSAAAGGVLDFTLDFPVRTDGYEYKILLSATGVGPTLHGVNIPLTADRYTLQAFHGIYPVSTHSNLHGTLDADGTSTASMTIPGGLPSAMIGTAHWYAAIASKPGGFPEHSSVVRTVIITP